MKSKTISSKLVLDLVQKGIETKKIRPAEVDLIVAYVFGIIHEIVKSNNGYVYSMFWSGINLYFAYYPELCWL